MQVTTREEFQKEVLEKDFVIVDFFADWCGPCRMIAPFLEEIQAEMNVALVKVNIDDLPDIATEYDVMSIPTVIIFKRGQAVSSNVGASSKSRLIDWIVSHKN